MKNNSEKKRKGFVAYLFLGAISIGMIVFSFSLVLTANTMDSFILIRDDIASVRNFINNQKYNASALKWNRGESFYSWESMIWISDVLPAVIYLNGRSISTVGMGATAYFLSRDTTKMMESLFLKMENNGVNLHEKTLGKMFGVAWGDYATIIVPSVKDQITIEFISSQSMGFPEGVSAAKDFWSASARRLVSSSSPVSFMDITW